jgi:nucleotide-binding universal stress UspA family protein
MFQRILLAWDGSRPALRALDTAVGIARRNGAEIVTVAVAYSPGHAETEADRVESVEAARRYLEQRFAAVRDRADRVGVPLDLVIIEGEKPADALLAYAHEHAFDLLVAGHHRNSRAGRFLIHGLSERLVEAAAIPVLIVGDSDGG